MNEAAFIASVLASPDDDAPRLIFADWLDENGQGERAEFIRVQVGLARWTGMMPAARFDGAGRELEQGPGTALRRRERELMCGTRGALRRWDWFGRHVNCNRISGEFRRGFVHAVTCTAAGWLRHGDAITAAQPIEDVTLTDRFSLTIEAQPGESLRQLSEAEVALLCAASGEAGERPLRYRWPRVKAWHLPPAASHPLGIPAALIGSHGTNYSSTAAALDYLRRLRP